MDDLPVTVPQSLHDAVADKFGEPFAVSYLCGAVVDRGIVFPRTRYAAEKLADALKVITDLGYQLGRPQKPQDRLEISAVTSASDRYLRTGHF